MATLLRKKYELEQRDGKEKHYVEHICNASDRMEQIIKDLLILSQVKKSDLKINPLDLTDIAQKIGDRAKHHPSP